MANLTKKKQTTGRKKSTDSKAKGRSSTTWRIVGPGGELVSVIHTGMPSTYFLPEESKIVSKESHQTKGVLVFGQIKFMINYLGYSQQEMAEVLEVDPSTLSRWKKDGNPLGKIRSKAMYDMDQIIAKGVRIFGSEDSFRSWLDTSNYALGDQKPIELIKDPYGRGLVDNAIEAMSWGNLM